MLKDLVGYRFSPTGEESINYYLKNKNLGKTSRVDDAISEINICNFEPKCLPPLAKINSDDLVWYFFSLIVYANSKKTSMKRTTGSGFWKPTGTDRKIKDKRGSEIGIKKTLVYHEGKGTNGVRTPWVMHEYHITCLPPNLTNYVLCQVKYKGDHRDISFGGNDSVVSHSDIAREINTVPEVQVDQPVQDGMSLNDLSYPLNVQEDLCPLDAVNPNLLQQIPEIQVIQPVEDVLNLNDLSNPLNVQEDLFPLDAINPNLLQQIPEVQVEQPRQYLPLDAFDPNTDFLMDELLSPVNIQQHYLPQPDEYDPDTVFNYADNENYGENNEAVIANQEFIMQENRNVYMPRKPLSGTIIDCSSDSDDNSAESISAMSYQGPSSSHDSVGSSSSDSSKDLQTTTDLSVNRKSRKHKPRRRTAPSKQEVKRGTSRAIDASIDKETSMVKTEKETMEINLKKPRFIHLMNMIIGLILLVGLIGFLRFVSIVNIRTTQDIRIAHQENEAVDASINKDTYMVKTDKETNLKKPRFIYRMNMVIGFILLMGVIGNIKYWNRF